MLAERHVLVPGVLDHVSEEDPEPLKAVTGKAGTAPFPHISNRVTHIHEMTRRPLLVKWEFREIDGAHHLLTANSA